MKIAILDDYQDVVRHLACFEMLQQHEVKIFTNRAVGTGQLAIRLAQFDAVVLIRERSRFSRALLQKLPKLKLISQTGKLAGHVDTAAARDCGIAITEGRGDPTAPAELTWTLIMAASRRLLNYASLLQEGCWQMSSSEPSRNRLGRVLKQRVLGIWGYGRIGKLVAGYGKAFGMQVLVWGSAASQAQAQADGYQIAATRAAFFADSDVISLHLRLNDATHGIVNLEDLSRMKRDALFVNTSRAELVAATALETALSQGRPGFAALDVFETEPLAAGHALLRYENVLATPHLGYVEQDSYELYFSAAFQNILDFSAGTPSNLYTGA
ncbi:MULTISPECIES: D-2-hydroxyacid dehydrogenase family protein [unclassified Undibacterium]|uniref:D-2-hydroxyacid dehydrogenase family protein n=1 Tax=unclassified Undibacterium TaxID=2630295 RepID=UPI002AC9AEFC|nr:MULTISPECIES: D-2-hydroxyacid dehydrogenase family protein [unclassified Undibacterium]MEB0137818.1 D-2-hydroxyacid dehydrogenase family protein [Undibacterium sp. CCC2.1]MEB0170991.1 D-2-hydroxyacid dehydrogenase family protein [Undibacterium sp. CCC1.1]MEB0175036.1 D-2-hydroxyacid dehydrogenase family protein [Undibacterium sp. CCC3.4]MEB0215186.1 D-2-hydroxyacid dehydrogenase family protein [Undibacterium sp. 5I2]WPX44842.1 D-2-hydroxyacid dehydrogenase family protein [Undibacterium sp. 